MGALNRPTPADAAPADQITWRRLNGRLTRGTEPTLGVPQVMGRWSLPPRETWLEGPVTDALDAVEQSAVARDRAVAAWQQVTWAIAALDDPESIPPNLVSERLTKREDRKAAEAALVDATRVAVEAIAEHRDVWLAASSAITVDRLMYAATAIRHAIEARQIASAAYAVSDWLAIRLPDARASFTGPPLSSKYPVEEDRVRQWLEVDAQHLTDLAAEIHASQPAPS